MKTAGAVPRELTGPFMNPGIPEPTRRARNQTPACQPGRWHLPAFLVLLACWTVGLGQSRLGAEALARRPNVVVLLADDLRADAIRPYGNRDVRTPALDRLSREGMVFSRAAIQGGVIAAVCVPSRASLMSGRSMFRFSAAELPRVMRDVPTIPSVLRAAGFRDFGIGKWHNGGPWLSKAFSDGDLLFLGGMGHHASLPVQPFDPTGAFPAARAHPLARHSSEAFADAAIEFLRRPSEGRPFFLYVAFTAPHDPRESPPGYREQYRARRLRVPVNVLPRHPFDNGELSVRDEKLLPSPRERNAIQGEWRDYYAAITHLDAQVGRILDALEAGGHGKDTVVVFASDNGLALGSHGLLGKQNCYEHSLRVPLILRGPGIPKAARSDALVNLMDLFPTLCDLAGVNIPAGLDGRSFAPVVRGLQRTHRTELLGAYGQVQRSLREDRWKIIRYPQVDRTQLFDLRHDPEEKRDLSGDPHQGGRLAELLGRLAAAQAAFGDTLPLQRDKANPARTAQLR